jgi:hypothetical protein
MARRGDGMLSPESAEAHEFHRVIRASVRDCLETWRLQTQAAPVTAEALELVVARAAVPILRLLGGSSAGFAGTTIPGGRPPKGGEAPFGGERGSAAPTVVATSR